MYAFHIAQRLSPEVLDRFNIQERFECWNRGEMDQMLQMYAADAVVDNSEVFPDQSPVQGHAELVRSWHRLRETWGGGVHVEPTEMFVLEYGRLVLECRLSGTGTHSRIEVGQSFAYLYTVRPDGKITEARLYRDAETAISAAGSVAARRPSPSAPTLKRVR